MVLCADGAVRSPVDLAPLPEHRRGHKAMYGGLNHGRLDVDRLRTVPAGLSLPRFDGRPAVLAADVPPWLRPDAPCSAQRLFCHVLGHAKTASQFPPGRPCSFVAVLEPGATSWTAILDAVRLGPATAAPLRGVVERLIAAGQWQAGDPHIVIVSDAGYDVTRLAWVLRDLPVELAGRVRSDRVMRLPEPPRTHGVNGRPPKHGPEMRFTTPETWPEPAIITVTDTTNDGQAETQAWDRVRPRLTQRFAPATTAGPAKRLGALTAAQAGHELAAVEHADASKLALPDLIPPAAPPADWRTPPSLATRTAPGRPAPLPSEPVPDGPPARAADPAEDGDAS
ncbi:transposase [Streptomyces asiaticus]